LTGRERVAAALDHKEADRIPIVDSPWSQTIQRWRNEGFPADKWPDEYFGYEMTGAGADTSFRFPVEVIEETDTYIVRRDANGARVRDWKDHAGTPQKTDFTVKTRRDWDEHKARLALTPDRVDIPAVLKSQDNARAAGKWFYYSSVMGYDKTQSVMGSENLLIAMAEEPDWCAEIFMTWADLTVGTAEMLIAGGVEFDGAFLYDDMGYRNSSLFSPAAYRQLLFPAHKKVYGFFHAKGMKVILHSCGRVSGLIPSLIEAGLDCLQPLEVKAGMDVVELKKQYGDALSFMGGIDVRCMSHPDPAVIEKEIRTKIPVARKGGGYIYHSDHSVPDTVSFAQYKHVMELVLENGKY
jgi:uroporphyrinogen decarboxylase